jgi:SSS family solute:Na+ symporter
VSLLIHELTGFNLNLCVIIAGIFVGTYTIFGGIDAVIWTDVIQTILLFLGGVLCFIIIVIKLPGGLSEIITVAVADNKLSFAHMENGKLVDTAMGFSLSEKTVSMLFIVGLLGWLKGHTAEQCTIQRYCSAKSTNEARKAVIVSVISSLPIWAFYMFLGTSLYVFFKQFPAEAATNMLNGTEKAEQILPFFIVNYVPIGLTGIVVASALAASMSSLDSSINAVSTLAIVDVYKRHIVKNKNDIHYLKTARVLATITSIIMIIGALVLIHTTTTTVRDMMVIVMSVFSAGLLGIYILGFFTKKGNAKSVGVGILFTILFTFWVILAQKNILPEFMKPPFDLYYTIIFGDLIMFILGYTLSALFISKPEKDLKGLTVWTLNEIKSKNITKKD